MMQTYNTPLILICFLVLSHMQLENVLLLHPRKTATPALTNKGQCICQFIDLLAVFSCLYNAYDLHVNH